MANYESEAHVLNKAWKFDFGETLPSFPYYKAGDICSNKYNNIQRIYYLIDQNYKIWIGLEKESEIIFKYFDHDFAMDIVFNYNILGCLNFENLFDKVLL